MEFLRRPRPLVLLILDGWGIAPAGPGNAITKASTPNISSFSTAYPHTQLTASGEAVGLPRNEPGNTETGHLNIGAGQIVYQDLLRINMSIADGTFFQNQVLTDAIKHVNTTGGNLHLMGLIGAGGVHSNIEHLFALLHFCRLQNFTRVYLHLFTDGRDSPPTSGLTYLASVKSCIAKEGLGEVASIMGRYYAMDRDFRWDRTQKAYLALTQGQGLSFNSPEEAIQSSYNQNRTDEFIEPSICVKDGKPIATIRENDAAIFFNFRIDRPRQLTKCFVLDAFQRDANLASTYDPFAIKYFKKHETQQPQPQNLFDRGPKIKNLFFVTLTEYEKDLPVKIAFPLQIIDMPLGRMIAERGLRQLRAAESEKERFVTYFFNGQREGKFPGEDHLIIPSPKVPTYDQKPEMSARELTTSVISHITGQTYDFILVNFANSDMVGHTGNFDAAVKAIEVLDECVGKIIKSTLAQGGCVAITADHGNAEEMLNPKTGQIDTEHSSFPVPFIIINDELRNRRVHLSGGILGDVAPTLLHILGIPKPPSMLGRNLLM